MTKRPDVKPRDWICIGTDPIPRFAVVSMLYQMSPDRVEAVYFSNRDSVAYEDFRWNGEAWEFALSGLVSGNADLYDRLAEYVAILRRGRIT